MTIKNLNKYDKEILSNNNANNKKNNHINFRNTPIAIFRRVKLLFDGDGLLSQEINVVVNDYTNNNNNNNDNNTRNGNNSKNNSDQDENEDLDIISTQVDYHLDVIIFKSKIIIVLFERMMTMIQIVFKMKLMMMI